MSKFMSIKSRIGANWDYFYKILIINKLCVFLRTDGDGNDANFDEEMTPRGG